MVWDDTSNGTDGPAVSSRVSVGHATRMLAVMNRQSEPAALDDVHP
jgi:hypothetical protein